MKDPKATYNKAMSELVAAIRTMIKRDALEAARNGEHGLEPGPAVDAWLDQVATDLQDQLNTKEKR